MRGSAGHPVRLRFTKRGKVRFISHRDVARAFDRAFRIEQLPLAFTEGFSPRPKVCFGLALSTGHEREAEYLDLVTRAGRETGVAWRYREPTPGYAALRDFIAFYPNRLDTCRLGDERVLAQAGDFYGGWVTRDLEGPFKGAPGTAGW